MERGRKTAFHEPIRPSTTLVRIQPPKVHAVAYTTGGLKTLYKKISLSKNRKIRNDHEFGAYTDNHGCFVPEESMPLLASRYRYLEILGKGNSSVLLKAEDTFRRDNNLVSIKILHVNYHALGYQEADCIRRLNLADPEDISRCVRLLNFFTFDEHYCMVFELLNPTPLHHYFRKLHSPEEKLSIIKKVAIQLLQVLGFLLRGNVIHADLKPENVLAVSGDLDNVKVIDFGNAIHSVPEEISLYYDDFELQTLLYRAPEVMMGLPNFALEIDMWSLGCILAELYIGKPLFFGMSKREILIKMTGILGPFPLNPFEEGKFFPELREFVSVHGPLPEQTVINRLMGELDNIRDFHFASFLAGLLKYDPRERMTVAQAAVHPFLARTLGMRYLMPADHPIARTFYPAVGVNPTSYRQRPHIELDLSRQNLRSETLLRMGTVAPATNTSPRQPSGKHRTRSRTGSGGSSSSSQNSTPRQTRIPQPSRQRSNNNNNNQPETGAVQYNRNGPVQPHGLQEVQKHRLNSAEPENVQYNQHNVQHLPHAAPAQHSQHAAHALYGRDGVTEGHRANSHGASHSGQSQSPRKSPRRRGNRRRYQTLPHRTSSSLLPSSEGTAVHRSNSLSEADVIDLTEGHKAGQLHSSQSSHNTGQTQPSRTSYNDSQSQPSRVSYNDSQLQPSRTSYNDSQSQPSRASYNDSQLQPSRTSYNDSQSQPSRASYNDSQSQPSRASYNDSQSQPSRASCNDSQSQPSRASYSSRPVSCGGQSSACSTSPLSVDTSDSDDEVLLISEIPTPLVQRLKRASSVPGPPTPPARRNGFNRKLLPPGLQLGQDPNMAAPPLNPTKQVRKRASLKSIRSTDPDSLHHIAHTENNAPGIAQEFSNIKITARGRSPTIKGIKKSKSLPEFEHVMIKSGESSPEQEERASDSSGSSRVRSLEDICQAEDEPSGKPTRHRKRSLTFMSSVSTLWNTFKPSVSALLGGPGRREETAGAYRRRGTSGKHVHASAGGAVTDISRALSPSNDKPSPRQPADVSQSLRLSAPACLEAETPRGAEMEVSGGKRRNNMSPTDMTMSPPKQLTAAPSQEGATRMYRNQQLRTSKKRREEAAQAAHSEQEKQNVRKIAQELIQFMQNHQATSIPPSPGRRSAPPGGQGFPPGGQGFPPGVQGYAVCAGHGGQLTRQALPRTRAASEGADRHRQNGSFHDNASPRQGSSASHGYHQAEEDLEFYDYSVDGAGDRNLSVDKPRK
ncbi:serine/arginine repetitive matrix protein 2-like isoform X1 [Branchiostoma floridae]|uniref:Serine/arginine repetitive matrix protein 2-like isoform X1 n=2 Tax=Branchiostoma floridae TaxID=7739 RepID=A0A9J7LCE8_BRAFL|nr:serine/arginine repetitive matrix protein 2-like isoform X1 [Branchiostoma floridae]